MVVKAGEPGYATGASVHFPESFPRRLHPEVGGGASVVDGDPSEVEALGDREEPLSLHEWHTKRTHATP